MNLPSDHDGPPGEIRDLDPASLLEAGLPLEEAAASSRPWPPPPEELAGALPGYEITALLGRGGMSAVYKGVQTSLEREVAIKLLAPKLSADPEFEIRFHREAKAMARLNHPNIVQVYDYGRTEAGQHYIVMEYVDGSDLHHIVRSGQLDAEGTLKAVTQVCDALQYAHSLGFVHRDIKPGNVLLNRQGVLKIGDFGLAKLLGESASAAHAQADERHRLTLSGAAMGTPHYAAPEQLDGQGAVDHRADLYSLGVMFYEMLTREMPRGAPKLPSRKIASLDARLDGVVFKAMAADPDERYQTAIALRTDVDRLRTMSWSTATETQEGPWPGLAMPVRIEFPAKTSPLAMKWAVPGAAAVLAVAGLVLFFSLRKDADRITAASPPAIVPAPTEPAAAWEPPYPYFAELIASGVTTAKDLGEILDIRPSHQGFIGISKEKLTWEQAENLAQRLGARILALEDIASDSPQSLRTWMNIYSQYIDHASWMCERGQSRVVHPHHFTGNPRVDYMPDQNLMLRVFFQWGAIQPTPAQPLLALALPSGVSGSVAVRSFRPSSTLPKQGLGAIPEEISRLTNVAMISAGARHGMALTAEGRLYRWGLLPSDFFLMTRSAQLPPEMTGEQKRVVQMIAGNSDAVLLEDGTVLTQINNGAVTVLNPGVPMARIDGEPPLLFGLDARGIISWLSPEPLPAALTIPEEVRHVPLREIHATSRNVLAIARDGGAFLWGHNDLGLIGLDPVLQATFKDDPVVDGLAGISGRFHVIVQQSGRFHLFGEPHSIRGLRNLPASVTGFAKGMACFFDTGRSWLGVFYSRKEEGKRIWSVIEGGDNRRRYFSPFFIRNEPLAIAMHLSETTMLMLVDPSAPIVKKMRARQSGEEPEEASEEAELTSMPSDEDEDEGQAE